jgi:hypothetical protein
MSWQTRKPDPSQWEVWWLLRNTSPAFENTHSLLKPWRQLDQYCYTVFYTRPLNYSSDHHNETLADFLWLDPRTTESISVAPSGVNMFYVNSKRTRDTKTVRYTPFQDSFCLHLVRPSIPSGDCGDSTMAQGGSGSFLRGHGLPGQTKHWLIALLFVKLLFRFSFFVCFFVLCCALPLFSIPKYITWACA